VTGWTGLRSPATRTALALGALGVLAATAPFFLLTSSYDLDVAHQALYMAGLCASWAFLAGIAGQVSFAHVALGGIAGYASAIWMRDLPDAAGGLPVALLVGVLATTLVGAALGALLLRLQTVYLSLFTLAFAEIVTLVIVSESELTGGRATLQVTALGGDALDHYYILLVALAFILACIYWIIRSPLGLCLKSMREDAESAAAMSVNIVRLKVAVFVISSFFVGVIAALYFHTGNRISPDQLDLSIMALVVAAAVIGGMDSPLAAALSAVLSIFLLELLRELTLQDAAWWLAVAVLVLVFLFAAWQVVRRARGTDREGLKIVGINVGGGLLLVLGLGALGRGATAIDAIACGLVLGGVWLLVQARRRGGGRSSLGRLSGWAAAAAVAFAAAGALFVQGALTIEVGVWRYAIFGLILALTVRFASNGLLQPALERLSGRHAEFSRQFEAQRDTRDDAEATR